MREIISETIISESTFYDKCLPREGHPFIDKYKKLRREGVPTNYASQIHPQ